MLTVETAGNDSTVHFSALMSKILSKILPEDINKSILWKICHDTIPYLTKKKYLFFSSLIHYLSRL